MAELNYNTTDWLNLYINTNPVLRPAWSSIVEINDQFNFVNEQKNKLLRIVAISFGKDANSANISAFKRSTENVKTTTIRIENLNDLYQKIVLHCGKSEKLILLEIVGHGNSIGQNIGEDWLDFNTLKKHKILFRKIEKYLHKDAKIVLGGCKVGFANALLSALSKIFMGRKVIAGTAYQRPAYAGLEGGKTTCVNEKCTFSGKTGWDYFDSIFMY